MRPTKEELNKKVWYRCFKVVAILIIALSSISPYIIHREVNWGLLADAIINVFAWSVIALIIRAIILYVLYGKREMSKELRSEQIKNIMQWILWGGGFTLFVGCLFYFLLVSSRNF